MSRSDRRRCVKGSRGKQQPTRKFCLVAPAAGLIELVAPGPPWLFLCGTSRWRFAGLARPLASCLVRASPQDREKRGRCCRWPSRGFLSCPPSSSSLWSSIPSLLSPAFPHHPSAPPPLVPSQPSSLALHSSHTIFIHRTLPPLLFSLPRLRSSSFPRFRLRLTAPLFRLCCGLSSTRRISLGRTTTAFPTYYRQPQLLPSLLPQPSFSSSTSNHVELLLRRSSPLPHEQPPLAQSPWWPISEGTAHLSLAEPQAIPCGP